MYYIRKSKNILLYKYRKLTYKNKTEKGVRKMVVKNIKITLIIILLILTFFMYSSTTYATDFGGIISGAEGFIDDADTTNNFKKIT